MKYKQLYLKSITDQRPGDDENYIIRGVFSTNDEDRQGDVVVQSGWDIGQFLLNPVVLFAHDHWQPAVGKIIEIGLNEDGNLAGAIQFAAKEYDFAMTLYKLYKGGYMRAFSAGFENRDGGYDEINNRNVLTVNVLYEMSCVNVPANAYALAKSAGIDVEPLMSFQEKQLLKRKSYHSKDILCDADESESECIVRKINEFIDGGYEKEQAVAIAYSISEKIHEEKSQDAAKCKINERLTKLEKAIGDVSETLTAIKKNGRQPSKKGKKILVKTFNKAIRSLLEEKNKIKNYE